MKIIENEWGPFSEEELSFYKKRLKNDHGEIINNFQRQLIFNLFYKYFGDTTSINAINETDYIKLLISARRMLEKNNMGVLPMILSSKVNKIVSRKTLNKKELAEMEASQNYQLVLDKYKSKKINQGILGTIATLITSSFTNIDFTRPELDGVEINVDSRFIIEETLLYILLI